MVCDYDLGQVRFGCKQKRRITFRPTLSFDFAYSEIHRKLRNVSSVDGNPIANFRTKLRTFVYLIQNGWSTYPFIFIFPVYLHVIAFVITELLVNSPEDWFFALICIKPKLRRTRWNNRFFYPDTLNARRPNVELRRISVDFTRERLQWSWLVEVHEKNCWTLSHTYLLRFGSFARHHIFNIHDVQIDAMLRLSPIEVSLIQNILSIFNFFIIINIHKLKKTYNSYSRINCCKK